MILDRLLSMMQGQSARNASGILKPEDDPRVAVAALLIHVIEADGSRDKEETRRLRARLTETYGLTGKELDAVVAAGEIADREAIDLYAFTNTIKRHLDPGARTDFIRMMWEMVYADGQNHELEDNIVWRVAELIGVENKDRIALRQEVRGGRADDRGD